MKLVVLPEAELEAADAVIWYDVQRRGLGDEFATEFEQICERLVDSPLQWPRVEFYEGRHDVRRCFMYRFPFGVIFVRRPEEVVVVAVAHMRREPLYWLDRIN